MLLPSSLWALGLTSSLAAHSTLAASPPPPRHRVFSLAGDLRIALNGLLAKRDENAPPRQLLSTGQKPYCIPAGRNTSPAATDVLPVSSRPFGSVPTAVSSGYSSLASIKPTPNSPSGSSPTSTATRAPTTPSTTRTSAPTSTRNPNPSPSWIRIEEYSGDSFFSKWQFDTFADLNGGSVTYLDEATSRAAGLVSVNNAGNVILRVDTTPQIQGNRNSHRLTSRLVLDNGLITFDAVHMPTGCGTWPAFWTTNSDWPTNGEIDIATNKQGVNDNTANQYTLHTSPGCSLPPDAQLTGTRLSSNPSCAVQETGGIGCGVRDASSSSFGAAFNRAGGGAYAMHWAAEGIDMWFWPRGSVPDDVQSGTPSPQGWGTPAARFPASGCSPYERFRKQSIVLDTALCGTLPNALWNVAGAPGQDVSCAQRTGYATCEQYVRERGEAFAEAYWEIKSVRVYQFNP